MYVFWGGVKFWGLKNVGGQQILGTKFVLENICGSTNSGGQVSYNKNGNYENHD